MAETMTDSLTPPAQATTAELADFVRGVANGNWSQADAISFIEARDAAARQTWEAERAVLVTEAVSAAAKIREMEERSAEKDDRIEQLNIELMGLETDA